jgi:catechol O-methyltransferase
MSRLTNQHIVDMHPSAVYPADWSDNHKEDRAGYISLEKSEVYAETARGAYELAGLGKAMKVSLHTVCLEQ